MREKKRVCGLYSEPSRKDQEEAEGEKNTRVEPQVEAGEMMRRNEDFMSNLI